MTFNFIRRIITMPKKKAETTELMAVDNTELEQSPPEERTERILDPGLDTAPDPVPQDDPGEGLNLSNNVGFPPKQDTSEPVPQKGRKSTSTSLGTRSVNSEDLDAVSPQGDPVSGNTAAIAAESQNSNSADPVPQNEDFRDLNPQGDVEKSGSAEVKDPAPGMEDLSAQASADKDEFKTIPGPVPQKKKGTLPENSNPQTQSRTTRSRPAGRGHAQENILGFDAERTVETQADKHASDVLDLVESLKAGKILSGYIQGVERSVDNPLISYAVVYHGDIKVIIPAGEFIELPQDLRGRRPEEIHHYLITKRLGAEVDYIVQGIDHETGLAAASRLKAMASRCREMYFGVDRDGNYLIYEGVCAEARVVSVIQAGLFADVLGIETYIPLRELSYQRWVDAQHHFVAGERILVRILSVDRSDRDNIQITASVKQAAANPYEAALKKYTVGNRYVGTVSMVDQNGVFVALDGGIDCLCPHPKRGRPPRGSRVTVRILGINDEAGRIWGAITHMTTST